MSVLVCPLHPEPPYPSGCLTQEGLPPAYIRMGLWRCTLTGLIVKPVDIDSQKLAAAVQTPE